MIRWRRGMVDTVLDEWPGVVEVDVVVEGPSPERRRALAYTDLVGTPRPGDTVLLNVNAVLQGLGTGGHAMVVALPDRLPDDAPSAGHLVKARYMPLQPMVAGPEEPDSAYHRMLQEADDLGGVPVVTADLHSSLAPICLAVAHDRPGTRVVHVMTDGAALPAVLSRSAAALREAGLLAGVVSTGQAYGGDVDCVSLHSGLLVATALLHAEVIVVAQGPGNLGTDTRWGFSGVAVGEAVNAAVVLGGRPVGALRVSQADPRERHRGISHHSLTAYGRVALMSADVVVPTLPGPFGTALHAAAKALGDRHRLVEVDPAGLLDVLLSGPVRCSSMGRGPADDPACFLAAAAAGRHAAALLA
jgi:hypothetical protein